MHTIILKNTARESTRGKAFSIQTVGDSPIKETIRQSIQELEHHPAPTATRSTHRHAGPSSKSTTCASATPSTPGATRNWRPGCSSCRASLGRPTARHRPPRPGRLFRRRGGAGKPRPGGPAGGRRRAARGAGRRLLRFLPGAGLWRALGHAHLQGPGTLPPGDRAAAPPPALPRLLAAGDGLLHTPLPSGASPLGRADEHRRGLPGPHRADRSLGGGRRDGAPAPGARARRGRPVGFAGRGEPTSWWPRSPPTATSPAA